jgi:predicted Zn finger-like uncharacterized protein
MHIVCPHCTTSFAIKPDTLGAAGRNVRCSRCKEVWLAHPADALEAAQAMPAMAAASHANAGADAAAEWEAMARQEEAQQGTPVVESPSISADWPAEAQGSGGATDWPSVAQADSDAHQEAVSTHRSRLARLFKLPKLSVPGLPRLSARIACVAMAALIAALMFWRTDVVRLLPQTATFYKMVGLDVNLRGLAFKDLKITHETVDGKPVLVIEGVIVGQTRKPVELPRLRFSVRDEQGAEIYAWNAVLEQPVLHPGERAYFKSRLASPPPEGRNIDVRFFTKRDMAAGRA